MSCRTPKKIFITNSKKKYVRTFQQCGNCYECQCETRGEWVFRVQSELKIRYPFFITLTYDNDHLPVYEPALKEWNFHKNTYINDMMFQHKLKRKWDYSYVRKDHLRDFFNDLQKLFQNKYFHLLPLEEYIYQPPNGRPKKRVRPIPGQEDKYLLRRYATAEYGTFSHRAHYHALLFFPINLHKRDVEILIRSCWHYGNSNVADDCRDAAINYVAKHQVKSDCGSTFQRRFAPIFKSVSTYRGGIGYNLSKDISNYTRYIHKDDNDEFDQRFFEVVDGSGRCYKIQFPRFLSRIFRKRYAKEQGITENLTDDELKKLSEKTTEIFCTELIKFISCEPDLKEMPLDLQTFEFYRHGKQQDYKDRQKYEITRFNKKRVSLLKKYGFTLNNNSDEPI